MDKISPAQIKAARALLNWSQEDLAQACDISISTIRTMELGKIPRASTLLEVRGTIERNGLEFTEGEGVKRKESDVTILRGYNSCQRLFEDIAACSKRKEYGLLVYTKSEVILTQPSGIDQLTNLDRLEQIKTKPEIKCLLMDTPKPSFSIPSFQCRTTEYPLLGSTSQFIYNNKYAYIMSEGYQSFLVIIFNLSIAAHQAKEEFLSIWKTAQPL
jgi:transcriptional regulator with XRE-family HTH domain